MSEYVGQSVYGKEVEVKAGEGGSEKDSGEGVDSALVGVFRAYSRRWEPPVGSVQIEITPKEANEAGGQWRVGKNEWQKSGATIGKISAGSCVVEFKQIEGWNNPKKLTVEVSRKQTSTAIAAYTKKPPPEYGSLQVTIEPAEVVESGAKWKVGGSPWTDSGETVDKVLVGKQKILLKPLANWNPPSGVVTVLISKDETSKATATYTKKPPEELGSLTVTVLPEKVGELGGQWRIAQGQWNKSGSTINDVKVGTVKVEFKPVESWIAPQPVTVEISKDSAATASGTYTGKKYPAPAFAVSGTIMGYNGGLAWIKIPGDKRYKAYFVGETIENYTLTKVGDGTVVFSREGFDYPLEVSKAKVPAKMDTKAKKAVEAKKPQRPPSRRKPLPRPRNPVKKE